MNPENILGMYYKPLRWLLRRMFKPAKTEEILLSIAMMYAKEKGG